MENDFAGGDLMSSTRTRVIQRLQEELEALQRERNDSDALQTRYNTLEKMCCLQQKKYKLQIDDLEFANDTLEYENHELKLQLSKLQEKLSKYIVPIPKGAEYDPNVDYAAKYEKWKTKYHALAAADPNANALFQQEKLDIEVKTLTAEVDTLKSELEHTQEQKQRAVEELKKANDTLKILQVMVRDYDEKNANLESSNKKLMKDNEKAEREKKQKDQLLQHSRTKEAMKDKELREREKQVKLAEEQQKKMLQDKQLEVSELQDNLAVEAKQRRRIEKQMKTNARQYENQIDDLKNNIQQLQDENDSLRDTMSEISNNASSIKEKFEALQDQKFQLERDLNKAQKYKIKSQKLAQTVTELQSTISSLTGDISNVTQQTINKSDDLKIVISRHFSDHVPGDWNSDLEFISQKFQELFACQREIQKLQKQIAKQGRAYDEQTQELENREALINELRIQIAQLSEALQQRGKVVQFADRTFAQGPTGPILTNGPQSNHAGASTAAGSSAAGTRPPATANANTQGGHPSQIQSPLTSQTSFASAGGFSIGTQGKGSVLTLQPFSNVYAQQQQESAPQTYAQQIQNFRAAVVRKVDMNCFEMTNKIREINAQIEGDEVQIPTARSLVLSMLLLTRWTHYDQTQPFDNATILQYAGDSLRDKIHPVEILHSNVEAMLQNTSKLQDDITASGKASASLSQKIQKLENQLVEANKAASAAALQISQLKSKISQLTIDNANMVPKANLADAQKQLQDKVAEVRVLNEQLTELKTQMHRLLNTIDETQQTSEDQRVSILTLNDENETLKHQLADALRELETERVSNKEKTKEILALERRISKTKSQIAVVKDQIPLSEQSRKKSCTLENTNRQAFFINDVVREDLEQMKLRLLNPRND